MWVLVRDACMQNLTLPQCHWWSLSCSLLCFWGWILMPPMGRGMLQMRSHFSFTRMGAHELPTLSTGGALHGGRRQLDRYDLVSRSGAAHKQQLQPPWAEHQHVQPMCEWTQEHPPPLPGLKTTGGRELKVELTHAASATRTAHCSVGAEPSELRASNAARLSSCPCIQSIPNLSVWRDCAPKWRPFTCSTSLRLVCSCCTQMGAIWAYDHATH